MNYLAHAYLAGPQAAHRVGGMLGDFIKGPLDKCGLPPDVRTGVALHRAIDSYAETHPAFCRSRNRVGPARRRYAGIMVDMFYDHLLARDWARHHPQPLTLYAAEIYALLAAHRELLPERFVGVFAYMRRDDWLSAYADTAQVGLALDRMSERRLSQPNPLAGAVAELEADYAGFAADFAEFIADARTFSAAHLSAYGG